MLNVRHGVMARTLMLTYFFGTRNIAGMLHWSVVLQPKLHMVSARLSFCILRKQTRLFKSKHWCKFLYIVLHIFFSSFIFSLFLMEKWSKILKIFCFCFFGTVMKMSYVLCIKLFLKCTWPVTTVFIIAVNWSFSMGEVNTPELVLLDYSHRLLLQLPFVWQQ